MPAHIHVLLLGGSGRVGRLVIDAAVRRGDIVTILARTPESVHTVSSAVRVVKGDALDANAVEGAVRGQDAVIYALGAGNVRSTTLFSDSTRILITAMERQRVRRLVCITGVGAGDTKGHGGFIYDRLVYPLFTKGIYADKDIQEALIRQSSLDWTIVRPASFRKSAPATPLRAVTDVEGVTLRTIAFSEVAGFVVDELGQRRYAGQAVFIGHE